MTKHYDIKWLTDNFESGDTFYLFTDGFPDQFGGIGQKKLKKSRFKQILCETAALPITSQRAYLEAVFDEWRNDADQIDDVTVMGILIP